MHTWSDGKYKVMKEREKKNLLYVLFNWEQRSILEESDCNIVAKRIYKLKIP